jgi:prepilin-type N-terminal cleavage/methylation domain-containing protein
MIRNEKGFTLIELMVVVLIIGILVAIAVPVFVNTSNKSKTRACQANLRTLDGAIQTFQADNHLVTLTGLGQLEPEYIKQIPKCPFGDGAGHTYGLVTSATAGAVQSTIDCGEIEDPVHNE